MDPSPNRHTFILLLGLLLSGVVYSSEGRLEPLAEGIYLQSSQPAVSGSRSQVITVLDGGEQSSVEFHREVITQKLLSPDGQGATADLINRRKTEGHNFLMPELVSVVQNTISFLEYAQSNYTGSSPQAITYMLRDLDNDMGDFFPYYRTVFNIFKAHMMLDYINAESVGVSERDWPGEHCLERIKVHRNHPAVYDENAIRMDTQDYPFHFRLSDIYYLNSDINSGNNYEDFCNYQTAAGLMSAPQLMHKLLATKDAVILPTFETISKQEFINASLSPVYFLRLSRGPVAMEYDERRGYTTGALFIKELVRIVRSISQPHTSICHRYKKHCLPDIYQKTNNEINAITVRSIYQSIDTLQCLNDIDRNTLKRSVEKLLFDYLYACEQCFPVADLTNMGFDGFAAWYGHKNPNTLMSGYSTLAKAWIAEISSELRYNSFNHLGEQRLCEIYQQAVTKAATIRKDIIQEAIAQESFKKVHAASMAQQKKTQSQKQHRKHRKVRKGLPPVF